MVGKNRDRVISKVILLISFLTGMAAADDAFDKLFVAGKYKEATDYADEKIPMASRDAGTWVKIAKANTELGFHEKALACYLVSWRLNPNDYQSLLGSARAYNNLNQFSNAIDLAKKALDVKFTAEASWEFARACIALNRSAEAKSALEKVIQTDSSNAIANKELGNIYFDEKAYTKAIPLLKKINKTNPDPLLSYKIGTALVETSHSDSAIGYLKDAVANGQNDAKLDLARAYYALKNLKDASLTYGSIPQGSLTVSDLYAFAVAKESVQGMVEAVKLYDSAIDKFGNDASRDALLAREKSARYYLINKKYDTAIKNLLFISENDTKANIVPDCLFLLSNAYVAADRLPNAIAALEKAIAVNSKNVEAYAMLAELYQKSNLPEKAKKILEDMLSLSPTDPGVYLKLGQYNLKAKKYSEASSMFDKSNSLKSSAEASEGSAIAAYNLNQISQARTFATRALSLNANLIDSRIILSKILFSENDCKGALGYLEFVTQKNSDNLECLKMLAECYRQSNNGKLTEIDKKIVALSSDDIDSRVRLAKIAEANKNLTEAITIYKELFALKANDSGILFKLYELSNAANDPVLAAIYLKKYLAIYPSDANAHSAYGDLLYAEKKMDEALNEYRTALKFNPTSKGFLKRYVEIVTTKGLQDEVISALNNLISSGEADVGTYTTLGLMYDKKKMVSRAIEMYQKALQLEPSNTDALSALAACQAANNDVNGAIISYEQVIMMNSKAVIEYKELGDLYTRSFKQDKAINSYRQFLAKDSSNLEIARLVGQDAFTNNDFDGAVRYLCMLGNSSTDDELLKLSEACLKDSQTVKEIGVLEKLKSRKLKVNLQIKVCKMLAEAFEKSGKDVDALKVMNELTMLPGAKDPDIFYKKAFLTEKSNHVASIKLYEENCKLYPADYRNFLRLGVLFSEKKESLANSISMLKRVTELASSVPIVWLELGKVYVKLEKNTEALEALKKYSETDPQSFDANRLIGILLMKMDRINEGLVYLEIANTLQPSDPAVMSNLAKGYMKTERNADALELLIKVKEMSEDDPDVRFQLYELYMKSGKKENANAEIKALVEMTHNQKYIILYAMGLFNDGKLAEAIDEIENILAADAENIDALMLKAVILRAQKKYDDAIELYKEISGIKPDYAECYYERAETHLLQNKIQWAEEFYKRAQKINPAYALPELGLAKIAKIRKDNAGYKAHLGNALKLDPNNKLITDELLKSGN